MDAHEAEEMVIAELDGLGKSILGQWADAIEDDPDSLQNLAGDPAHASAKAK